MFLPTGTISPACLPADPEETFGYRKVIQYYLYHLREIHILLNSSEAIITGWGYTEETKTLLPRPLTSDVLREASVYILPQDLCIKYSPFPITDKELKSNIFPN